MEIHFIEHPESRRKEIEFNETLEKPGSINEIRVEYEYREKAMRDELSRIQGAREEGERKKAELTARNLLNINISVEITSKATGLSKEEINKLK
ncbi:MAG TPA: hypothetical protein PK733_07300 [Clostridiales bacterium]|nr:hypothetical protein [Clostridiales bacterium]